MSNAWETFRRKIIAEMWDGALTIDCSDVEAWALDAGLIHEVAYDPAKHGDGPADFDVMPGDPMHEYRPEYQK